MQDHFDILIVGGGMVGATLATALSRSRYSVALIEAHALDDSRQSAYDDRSIALSHGSSRILQCFNLWPALAARAEPIQRIHVSDRGHLGVTQMVASEEGVPALGYVIESRAFGEILMQGLNDAGEGFGLYCPSRLTSIRQQTHGVSIEIETQDGRRTLNGKLLVAADGASSAVREMLGIDAEQSTYGQSAIIANITPQLHHKGVAYERFTASGPVAVLPMRTYRERESRCAIIWTVPTAQQATLMSLDDQQFLDVLQKQFGYRLGRFIKTGRRSAYPLMLVNSAERITSRTVFIGNAAQSLHPVAGQGFNLALRDVAALVDCLHRFDTGDPGDAQLLHRYRDMRENDQRRVIRFTDSLVKLFSNDIAPLAQVRALGLLVMDILPGLRRQFVRQAMGAGMPLPRMSDVSSGP
jgi:2-octaprenyl-6-methoxyphenol hydroxylase